MRSSNKATAMTWAYLLRTIAAEWLMGWVLTILPGGPERDAYLESYHQYLVASLRIDLSRG